MQLIKRGVNYFNPSFLYINFRNYKELPALLFTIFIQKCRTMKNRRNEIRELWEQGFGQIEISRKLNLSTGYVSIAVRSIYGDNYIKRFVYKRRVFKINENFFETINTEAKAYFLGLLSADGNIAKNENRIRIGLHEKDKYILEEFNKQLEYEKPLKLIKKEQEIGWNRSNQYLIEISSSKMRKDLEKYGLTTSKSLTLKFPTNIPKEYLHHFIRGYFDGDGCISVGKKKNNVVVSIAGSKMYCENLSVIFNNLSIYSTVSKHYKSNCYYNRIFSKKSIMNFYIFLYKESTIYLQRKKQIFDTWILDKNKVDLIFHKKILQCMPDGTIIREWDSARDICNELSNEIKPYQIWRCCKTEKLYGVGKGFIWKYKPIIV